MTCSAVEAAETDKPVVPWRVTSTGLEIDRELSEGEWQAVGRALGRMLTGLQWAIGDWLTLGRWRGEEGDT